jgi:hypothetical protein
MEDNTIFPVLISKSKVENEEKSEEMETDDDKRYVLNE